MNFLDMKTVLVTILATDILCTIVLVQLWRQGRERFSGTGYWALDFACHTVALFLILLRGSAPDWMSIVLANMLVFLGALWGYMGLQRFVGLKGSQRHNWLLLVAFCPDPQLLHVYPCRFAVQERQCFHRVVYHLHSMRLAVAGEGCPAPCVRRCGESAWYLSVSVCSGFSGSSGS